MSLLELSIVVAGFLGVGAINTRLLYYIRDKHRFLYTRLDRLERLGWDAPNVIHATAARSILPRAGGWAASVDILAEMIRLIDARRPELVVELGSGLSTVVIASKLRQIGSGRLVSIDHDSEYAALTQAYLRANQVEDVVDLRLAPLVRDPVHAPEVPWYDTGQLSDLRRVDMLIVDGPPMPPVHPLVRAPSLPYFRSRLRGAWCVLLDDADRPGKQEILANWQRLFPDIDVRHLPTEKGAALATPSKSASTA